jgi:Zn-dependent peptidase ImmA (M78 family)
MERADKEQIIEKVNLALDGFSNKKSPIDLHKLVEYLGGSFDRCFIPSGADASIWKDSEKHFVIKLDEPQPSSTRERFSIAHELGHLFLHMGYKSELWEKQPIGEEYDFKRLGSSTLEHEANQFAAELLMPKQEFINVCHKNYNEDEEHYDLGAISKYFQVSLSCAATRGKWLNLFKW